jgi:hypothetical protein
LACATAVHLEAGTSPIAAWLVHGPIDEAEYDLGIAAYVTLGQIGQDGYACVGDFLLESVVSRAQECGNVDLLEDRGGVECGCRV